MTRGGRDALGSNPSTQIPVAPPEGVTGTWTVSLAEIEAMGRKAARGAGLSWGLAEEAGRAARDLAARGLPGPEALAALLAETDGAAAAHAPRLEDRPGDRCLRATGRPLCPLAAGAALSDHAHLVAAGCALSLGPVLRPVLLLPFLVRAARDLDLGISVTGEGVQAAARPDGPAGTDWGWARARVLPGLEVRRAGPPAAPPRAVRAGARPVALGVWRALDRFAHRTYVPASAASRSGAGAGASDGD